MNFYRFPLKFLLRQVLIFTLVLSVSVPVALIQPSVVYADKAGICGIPGKDGPAATLSGVVNTYYPGSADVVISATSIPVGSARAGGGPSIEAGDLLLVVQMQGANLDGNNDERYGDGVGTAGTVGNTVVYSAVNAYAGGNLATNFSAGFYEYVVATGPVSAGSVPISTGLVNNYFSAAFGTQGQRTFQVIRVPQYSNATLSGTVTALRWDGRTGGIVAFDVAGALSWNGNTVDVSTLGFRGGGGRRLEGGAGVNRDYVTLSTNNANGSKGEGYAGTPRFINNNGVLLDNGVANEGFPNGSYGRGASGNGGGGSTDGDPAVNDQNSGGGGGGNGGFGGMGGNAWNSGVVSGGFGGAPFPGTAPRLILGGGGGAGTTNDGTGTPTAGFASSGAAGGGVVMIRSGTITGIGAINANGATANQTVLNDGGGGGGAGGSVVVIARNGAGSVGTLTVNAFGGDGGNNWQLQPGAFSRHGPGGGGGGGFIFTSGVLAAGDVRGGLNGTSTTANDAFGATPGGSGSIFSNISPAAIPTSISGANCVPVSLTTTKVTSTPIIVAGTTATYTITVSNAIGAGGASGVDISDVLPAGFTYASTGLISLSGNAVRAVIADPAAGTPAPTWGTFIIPGGGSVAITFTVNVDAATPPGTYQNPATATFLDPVRTIPTGILTSSYDYLVDPREDVTVTASAIQIVKSVAETTYAAVGTILHYSYLVTNSGNVTLNGPFTVTDDKSTDESCPVTASLAPGASITCTATYTVTQADIDSGSVTNIASAHGFLGSTPLDSATDTETVNAAQNPLMTVAKTQTSTGPYAVNDTITYSIVVTNTGNVTLTSVSVTDNSAIVGACTPAQPSTLAPNATMTCPAIHVVTQADVNTGSYVNTATGDSDQTPPTDNTVTVNFTQSPAHTILKRQTSTGPYAINDTINYSIVVTNTGNVTLTGVSVTDNSATVGACTPAQPSTLAPNATMTCPASHVVTQADLTTGTYVNTATADSNQTPPSDSTVTVNFTQSPSLTIVKSVAETTYASVGTILHYSYLVTNSGNVSLSGPFTVTDDKSIDESCPATASLAPGSSITCTATYTITQADIDSGSVTNIASTHGFFGSTPVDSGTDTETVNAAQNPLMTVVKSSTTTNLNAPGTVTYNYLVTNTGNITLTSISLSDDNDNNDMSCPATTLAPNATMTCSATHTFTQAELNANGSPTAGSGFLTNIVTASSNEAQSATDTLNIPIANVDLSLTKTVNNTSPKVGDAVVFTITITNHSLTTAATNVVVDDVLPVGLTFNSATPSLGSFSNVTGDWTIATLAANTSATLLVNVTVTQIGVITNTAEVVAVDQSDIDSTPNNHVPTEDDQASVSIGGLFDPPSGIKSFSEAGLPQLEFRLVWINSGNTTAINTQVIDNIPTGTAYVSGSVVCTPLGSSANAVAATVPLNASVANSFCAFDPINNRVQWQGSIGPDNGNLTEATAVNEVVITFRVTVNDGVNQVLNFGSSRTDTDGDTDFTDETVLGTSLIITNQVVWNRSAVVVADDNPGNTPAVSVASSSGFLIPVTGFAPNIATKLNPPSGPAYESTNLTIKIPSIKVNTSIVGVEQKDEDWDVSWLQNQAGWLSGTAYPTWKGNSVVTAHVVNADGKPGVFFKLKHLKSGEYIFVYNRGYRYTYKVESNEFVQPDDISVLKHETKSYLTLITCDTYDEDTGTYLRRVAVRAVLVDVREIK